MKYIICKQTGLLVSLLIASLFLFSCRTYKDIINAQIEANIQAKADQEQQRNLEWQTRDEYISAAKSAWNLIKDEKNPKVFENYLEHYYNGDIYYFLYEPALIKIAESFAEENVTTDVFGSVQASTNGRKLARIAKNLKTQTENEQFDDINNESLIKTDELSNPETSDSNVKIHFVHNYGLGLNPTVVLDTRKPEDQFIPGNIYIFDFIYINRKVGNSLLADTAYWAPTEIENSIGLNRTEVFLRNAPESFHSYTRNWYVILRYVGETRVFTVNGTSDVIESFDVLWFNSFFNKTRLNE